MIEKIKEKIDYNKKDKSAYKEYIKSFVNSDKAKELFGDNEYFKELNEEDNKEGNKEEDEFF